MLLYFEINKYLSCIVFKNVLFDASNHTQNISSHSFNTHIRYNRDITQRKSF